VTPERVLDAVKVGVLLFVVAIVEVSILAGTHILGGTPDLLLVTLVAVALLRGTTVGAVGGFFAGLVVDTANLQMLGLTSLLLTVAGYWIGRYGETTGRDRGHAPFLSVAVVTLLYALGALLVHFMLGEHAPAGTVMTDVWPTVLLNLILTAPVYAIARRLLRPLDWADRAQEVRLLG
jgi:rod shape-determining protein MreD